MDKNSYTLKYSNHLVQWIYDRDFDYLATDIEKKIVSQELHVYSSFHGKLSALCSLTFYLTFSATTKHVARGGGGLDGVTNPITEHFY